LIKKYRNGINANVTEITNVTPLTMQNSAVLPFGIVTVTINTKFYSLPNVLEGPSEYYHCNGVEDIQNFTF
jgi:hypothetical protein